MITQDSPTVGIFIFTFYLMMHCDILILFNCLV